MDRRKFIKSVGAVVALTGLLPATNTYAIPTTFKVVVGQSGPRFRVVEGSLPKGLYLNEQTGIISGVAY